MIQIFRQILLFRSSPLLMGETTVDVFDSDHCFGEICVAVIIAVAWRCCIGNTSIVILLFLLLRGNVHPREVGRKPDWPAVHVGLTREKVPKKRSQTGTEGFVVAVVFVLIMFVAVFILRMILGVLRLWRQRQRQSFPAVVCRRTSSAT